MDSEEGEQFVCRVSVPTLHCVCLWGGGGGGVREKIEKRSRNHKQGWNDTVPRTHPVVATCFLFNAYCLLVSGWNIIMDNESSLRVQL